VARAAMLPQILAHGKAGKLADAESKTALWRALHGIGWISGAIRILVKVLHSSGTDK